MIISFEDFDYSVNGNELIRALSSSIYNDYKVEKLDYKTIRFLVEELCLYEDEELLDIYKDDIKDYVLENFVGGV